jgi:beta-lactam-binding protein with PASTA domain
VTVWVSAGPAGGQVDVPNLVGQTQDAALAQLEALKLAGNPQPIDSNKPAGEVVSQSPKPGQLVVEGSTVTLQVSNGPKPTVSVPAVIGMTEAQAKAKLVMSGLKGHATRTTGDAPAGTVMDQTPGAGQTVDRGSTVEIIVSTGPPPTTTSTTPEPPPTTTTSTI